MINLRTLRAELNDFSLLRDEPSIIAQSLLPLLVTSLILIKCQQRRTRHKSILSLD